MERDGVLPQALKVNGPQDRPVEGRGRRHSIRTAVLGWVDLERIDKGLEEAWISAGVLHTCRRASLGSRLLPQIHIAVEGRLRKKKAEPRRALPSSSSVQIQKCLSVEFCFVG
jgi:hypothetical protein